MRTRILVTNGKNTIDLIYVEHRSTDVYAGLSRGQIKTSYHASGRFHHKMGNEVVGGGMVKPLKDLTGVANLVSVTFDSPIRHVDLNHAAMKYSGRKGDAILLIDARAIPQDAQVNVAAGVVAPSNTTAIWSLVTNVGSGSIGPREVSRHQLLLACAKEPWVYALVTLFTRPSDPHRGPR